MFPSIYKVANEYGLNLCGVQLETWAVNEIICAVSHFCVVPTPWSPDASGI
jgi:hypothetical protein